jgi:hypothetical protein
MAGVMACLQEHGYDGCLTLEIDDLNLGRPLSAEEKIALLTRDCAFMQESMG